MRHRRVYEVGPATMSLEFGDLLSSGADVLVSSDDYMLSMGGGVSAAIARQAGSALELDVAKSGPRRLGDVVVTTAGALPARYVFHVVTIGPPEDRGGPAPPMLDVIARATERCLALLEPLGQRSIAFPALGTGVAGVSMEDSAVGMANAIWSTLDHAAAPLQVEIFLRPRGTLQEADYIAFFEVFASRLPLLKGCEVPDTGPPANASGALPPGASRVLALEQERTRIERELAEARGERGGTTAEALARDLQANAEERAEAYDRTRRQRSPLSVFISYAHEDETYKEGLEGAMAGLRYEGIVRDWSDRRITPGSDWQHEISTALEQADIALFLISNDFLSSPYCMGVELMRALERHREGSLVAVPVIARPSDWKPLLGELQALPTDGLPISKHDVRDEAYLEVVMGLRRLIEQMRERPGTMEGQSRTADP